MCTSAIATSDYLLFTDTAYTERYMGLARSSDNYRAYDVSYEYQLFPGGVEYTQSPL